MVELVEVKIPEELYKKICNNCSNPTAFCIDALKNHISQYPVD